MSTAEKINRRIIRILRLRYLFYGNQLMSVFLSRKRNYYFLLLG